MAKAKAKKELQVTDRTFWYSDLAFMPPEDKNELWCAQQLFFIKMNAVSFLDSKRFREYKALERGEIDTQQYVNIIDPPTPMGGGGKAQYFASDFKTCPIDIHVDNIIRAKLDKICQENQLQVNEIDKYSKSQRQKAKDKIIYREIFRDFINDAISELGPQSGFTKLGNSEDPYEFVQRMNGEEVGKSIDNVQVLIDYIGKQIKDEQDMALYETYVYKGDIERAFELGIKHYLVDQNKWRIISDNFNNDLKNFNRACGRWYIDETTGRGVVEYLQPDTLLTSPFRAFDGEDVLYWFYEKDITFAEFVRQFGIKLNDQQLKEVFELNKINGTAHGLDFVNTTSFKRNNALIRIGYCSVLTQDAPVFSEELVGGEIPAWTRPPREWKYSESDKESVRQKIYNVWYSFYYIPPPGNTLSKNTPVDWNWQAQYIFKLEKELDMYRYGIDRRYAKSSLIIWKDDRMSFTDVKEAFMPKIRTNWHKLQNCFVQDTTALAIDYDFIGGLLNAVDEGNKVNPGDPSQPKGNNGYDAGMEAWKALKQGGIAFMKFRDKNGNVVVQDPAKFFVGVNSGHIDKAEKYIQVILELYNMMVMSLAQNDVTQGQQPKPRTPVAGVQAALAAANNGTWFIEKPVREFFIMFGERCVQMILNFVKERTKYGYEKRWQEFQDVVGLSQALMVEGIEDLDAEDIGLTVSLEDTTANKEYVIELANNMASKGEVGYDAVGLVMETAKNNYKYAYALLMVEKKRKEREMADQQELDFQRQTQLQQQQLQIAITLKGADTQGKQTEIQTQGEVDERLAQIEAQLKTQSMLTQKEQLLQNKLVQDQNKEELKRETEVEKVMSPMTV